MGLTSEIFLTKSFVGSDEWLNFIKQVSKYNGLFKNWKMIITINKNKIRYFLVTRCSLPTTINNHDSFMIKRENNIKLPDCYFSYPFYFKESNIIDLVNYFDIKKKGKVKFIEINFRKVFNGKIIFQTYFYVKRFGLLKKRLLLGCLPWNFLSLDFVSNKRYFYKSSPKFLDISKSLHLLSSDKHSSILKVDTFPYLQGDYFLKQNSYCFNKHSVVFGSSGCGKSKFISLLIENIRKNRLFNNYKVVVIDPHASLENDVGGLGKVIDFKNVQSSIDLFLNKKDDVVVSTELLLDLFKSLIQDNYNSKLERVLRHSIYMLLIDESFSFTSLRKVLLELEYRNSLIRKLKGNLPSSVLNFFLNDFNELKSRSYGEAISPIISFIDEMEMLPVFNDDQCFSNLKETIDNNFLTVFSLDRTRLGDKVTKTIAGLIMQQLFMLVQGRCFKEHIIFVIDEVAVIENLILTRYLSEARKYNVSLILAGQYFSQISDSLKNAIFANVVNYYIFRVSRKDAIELVDNFNMKIPLDDTKEQKIKLLTELKNRECVVRIDCNGVLLPAFKGCTLDFVSIPRKDTFVLRNTVKLDEIKTNNKMNFGISNSVSLQDIMKKCSSSRKVVK